MEEAKKELANFDEQVRSIFNVNAIGSGAVVVAPSVQVRQNTDFIGRLRIEVDEIKVEAEHCKGNLDRIASEKESVRAQLASTENQLGNANESIATHTEKIKELQY